MKLNHRETANSSWTYSPAIEKSMAMESSTEPRARDEGVPRGNLVLWLRLLKSSMQASFTEDMWDTEYVSQTAERYPYRAVER